MGWCAAPGCSATFVIDRAEAPWSRARTCSDSCRARLGNRGRHGGTCEHCAVVESWRELAASQFIDCERAGGDEYARPITYREFLTGHRYSNAPCGWCGQDAGEPVELEPQAADQQECTAAA